MSTPGQRAGGNGGVGWVDPSRPDGSVRVDLRENVAAAFRQANIAREALAEIAARGVTFRDITADNIRVGPHTTVPAFRCRCCSGLQQDQGRCDSRECPSQVAQRALDAMRRAL